MKQVNEEWAKDKEQRDKRIESIQRQSKASRERERPEKASPQWYVNSQGQTMVVFPGPVEFLMGSPPTEDGRDTSELQHKKRIGRTFAIAARSVTVAEYRRYDKNHRFAERHAPTPECPAVPTTWYQAAA